jgi:hypothetical protein
MNKRFLYPTICFAAFAIGAYADPACQAGLVSSIANTTCMIGDKTLAFGNAAITGNNPFGLTTDQFTFIPDSSNPIAPSF